MLTAVCCSKLYIQLNLAVQVIQWVARWYGMYLLYYVDDMAVLCGTMDKRITTQTSNETVHTQHTARHHSEERIQW
jgi:hypothetical protein